MANKFILFAAVWLTSSLLSAMPEPRKTPLHLGSRPELCFEALKKDGYRLLSDGTAQGAWGLKSSFPSAMSEVAENLGLELPYGTQIWEKGEEVLKLHFSANTKSLRREPMLFWIETLDRSPKVNEKK